MNRAAEHILTVAGTSVALAVASQVLGMDLANPQMESNTKHGISELAMTVAQCHKEWAECEEKCQ